MVSHALSGCCAISWLWPFPLFSCLFSFFLIFLCFLYFFGCVSVSLILPSICLLKWACLHLHKIELGCRYDLSCVQMHYPRGPVSVSLVLWLQTNLAAKAFENTCSFLMLSQPFLGDEQYPFHCGNLFTSVVSLFQIKCLRIFQTPFVITVHGAKSPSE